MIVAVASGKGGTGKTTVTAALARVWKHPVLAVDLDVEEPNLHLFLRPEPLEMESVHLEVPTVDHDRCTRCGICVDHCQFKALAIFGTRLVIFPELCHGCGGCFRLCPEGALERGRRELGTAEWGLTPEGTPCLTGRLRIGEALSPPLMKQVRRLMHQKGDPEGLDILIDAPPGVSCPAMTAVDEADVVLLVTEPTPFGLHDLRLAVQAFRPLGRPMGVVINRSGLGDDRVQRFCKEQGLPVLLEIPFRRDIAAHYAKGGLLPDLDEELNRAFRSLAAKLEGMALPESAHA